MFYKFFHFIFLLYLKLLLPHFYNRILSIYPDSLNHKIFSRHLQRLMSFPKTLGLPLPNQFRIIFQIVIMIITCLLWDLLCCSSYLQNSNLKVIFFYRILLCYTIHLYPFSVCLTPLFFAFLRPHTFTSNGTMTLP